MALCNHVGQDAVWRDGKINDAWGNFISHKSIRDRFADKYGKFTDESAAIAYQEFGRLMEYRLEVPWNQHAPLAEHHFNRAKVEISDYANALKGKFKNLAWYTPEGISKQDPTARRFYTELNKIIDYERVQTNKIVESNAKIADLMLEAYINTHELKNPTLERVKGKYLKRKSPELVRLEEIRARLAKDPENITLQGEFIAQMEGFVKTDAGRNVGDFLKLVHMSQKDFNAAGKKDWVDNRDVLPDGKPNPDFGKKMLYQSQVYEAVKIARVLLNDMGKVQVRGLEGLKKLVAMKFTGISDVSKASLLNKRAASIIKKIDDSIQDMTISMRPDSNQGYFPHMDFQSMTAIKAHLSKAFESAIGNTESNFTSIMENILIKKDWIPRHAKKRSDIDFYWEKDPLLVLSEYGNQAQSFNKLIYTQLSYLNAMKGLGNAATSIEFAKGMKRFIDEEYTVFTQGTSVRPEWVNNTVRTLNAFQTARTMGLNITGATKNALSAIHFYSRIGFKAGADQIRDMTSDPEFAKVMERVENRAGFKFTKTAATELYAEGIITKNQRDFGEVRFNEKTGQMEFKGQDETTWTKVRDVAGNAGNFLLDKALILHRITENFQRRQMFRTAFHKKYKWLTENGYGEAKSEAFARNFALNMVNGFAYEYAAHAKSKMVRGQWKTVEQLEGGGVIAKKLKHGVTGGMSEVAFHLLHYPMSLAETHYSAFKGIIKSMRAKQGMDSEEIQYALRYAGASSLIALFGVIFNTNLFNIIENESINRVQRIYSDLTEYDEPQKGTFGLMSEFTGPTLGMLKYFGIVGGIIDIDNSTLNKILFGNVDYADPGDELTERYKAYQLSTEWGAIKNNYYPSYKRGSLGRDFATHTFKLYPSWWTKEARRYMPGVPKKKRYTPSLKKGRSKETLKGIHPNLENSLKILEGLSK
tara:strand:+ start:4844 stop:7624 length:2781 start_codon:yes stop_codon:yes gene_type:complete